MSHAQIQCQNCGKQYKIPTTFKGAAAKCKACGTSIDVRSQLDALANPSKSEPAQKKPAEKKAGRSAASSKSRSASSSRSKAGSKSRSRGAAEEDTGSSRRSARGGRGRRGAEEDSGSSRKSTRRTAAAGRRGRRGAEDDYEEEGGRRGRPQRKDNTVMIGAISAGVLALIAGVILFVMWDDLFGAEKPKVDVAKKEAQEQADKKAKLDAEKKAAEADAKKDDEGEPKEASAKPKKKKPKKKKKKPTKTPNKVEKMEDIYRPKDNLEEIAIADDIKDAATKASTEIATMVTEKSGLPFIRAKKRLIKLGFAALPPIFNKLRVLDYSKEEDTNVATPFMAAVEEISGWDPRFAPVHRGEEPEPQVAHDNGRSVKELHYYLTKVWTSEDKLAEWRKKNADK